MPKARMEINLAGVPAQFLQQHQDRSAQQIQEAVLSEILIYGRRFVHR
jgi:hypothetical protein